MTKELLKVTDLSIANVGPATPRPILKNLSLSVAESETLAILGRSGAGKSVLGRALMGWVDAPLGVTSGRITLEGQDVLGANPDALRRIRGTGIGYVGADPTRVFDPTLPVGRQIADKYRAVRPEVSAKEAMERVHELFSLVRIPEARHRMAELPSKYSGGMIQRAAIVDAMIGETKLVIADNVTQPLDVTVAAQIIRLFQDLRERLGTAFLFITSSVPTIKDFADRIVVMDQGEIVEEGPTPQLLAAPRTEASEKLIAQSPRIWGTTAPESLSAEDIRDMPPALSITALRRTYKVPRKDKLFGSVFVQAVRGADFDVYPGESLAIVGESGCGKSTLMRLLTWLEEPDDGSVQFHGKNVGSFTARERFDLRAQLQLVLQDPYGSIPAHWTIGRTISESLRLHSPLKGKARRARVEETMAEVGLDPALYDKLPSGLSAGQRQRINVARAIVLEPTVLLLDETFSALDPMEQTPLIELFRKLQRERSITCIFISHDLALVRRVASRVAVMYLGRIVEIGSNHNVFSRPLHPYTRALLSAAPTIEDSPYDPNECLVDGEPPSPIRLPKGCAFADRCPVAQEACMSSDPELMRASERSRVACHFPLAALEPASVKDAAHVG
ncbi:ABC transporter ATP-binding protein [Pseudooceanicola sp. CBS1P-1]|nr:MULTISPECIES: ABC transporter ATP-binding protein [Pseudooceanicola]MBT9385303.1 ABC transporter ATP-binding protein [Pseudooceanicola endophyticus]